MAAITVTQAKENIVDGDYVKRLWRESGAGSGTEDDTFTTTLARAKKLKGIIIAYSAAPTYTTNVTANLDSALGAAYDVTAFITLGTADNEQFVVYLPGATTAIETGATPLGPALSDFIFSANDQLVIAVPDGGGSVTVTCTVYWEEMR